MMKGVALSVFILLGSLLAVSDVNSLKIDNDHQITNLATDPGSGSGGGS